MQIDRIKSWTRSDSCRLRLLDLDLNTVMCLQRHSTRTDGRGRDFSTVYTRGKRCVLPVDSSYCWYKRSRGHLSQPTMSWRWCLIHFSIPLNIPSDGKAAGSALGSRSKILKSAGTRGSVARGVSSDAPRLKFHLGRVGGLPSACEGVGGLPSACKDAVASFSGGGSSKTE
jgi:hypothetical protein